METIAADSYGGRADLPHLATSLQMEVDDLFPVAETLQLLRFTEISEGDIRLADPGNGSCTPTWTSAAAFLTASLELRAAPDTSNAC
jgi:hypothetical protein